MSETMRSDLFRVHAMVLSTAQMRAWRLFLEAHAKTVRRLEQELADEQDLALSWYDLLVQLQEHGGTMRMGELARRLLISRSATTRFVDRVEAAGLVKRSVSSDDRRGMDVVLTDEGFRRLKGASPTHLRGIERHFADRLSDEDAELLARILAKLG